jgi:hypothetical protein
MARGVPKGFVEAMGREIEAEDTLLFTAPNWVWVLGFTLSGFAIAGSYAAFRRSPMFRREPRRAHRLGEPRRRLRTAA